MMSTKQTPQLSHQEIAGFKIWYADSVYSSNDGSWNDAPEDGVQVVMIYFKHRDSQGRHTRLYSSGCDYYALNTKGELTSDFDDVKNVDGIVKLGRFMNYEALLLLEEIAHLDYGMDIVDKPLNELID